jgi:diadenosine tetraphosphatase ApaH/serine/threonine PP2A family protein phosphatase
LKYAILSAIHADLEALQAVLRDSKEQACTHYAFLGDFVGYGADPRACLDILRAMNAPCVKGNCDEYCATNMPLHAFNASMVKAIEWTRRQITYDDRRWLNKLPHVRTVENFTTVHATLDAPKRWQYVFDRLAAASSFSHQKTQLCFFGHTHVPVAFVRDNTVRGGTYTGFRIEPDKRYFVNVGSVGQPRDGNPNAAYVIYTMDKGSIELRRLPYDIAEAQRKIRDASLGR